MTMVILIMMFGLWLNWGWFYGIISDISTHEVPYQPTWMIIVNGPLWWLMYVVFRPKLKEEDEDI